MINKLIRNFHIVLYILIMCSCVAFAQHGSGLANKASALKTAELMQSQIIAYGKLEHFKSQVERVLPRAKKELYSQLGLSLPNLKIHLSANKPKMRALAERQHKFTPPSWSAGLAYPRSREIYLPEVPHNQLLPLLKHELVHIALGQYNEKSKRRLPLWINEGIAVAIGEGLSWERLWTLNETASQNALLKFQNLLHHFPHSGTQASIAYAQSAHFIAHLRETQTDLKFKAWLSALLNGESLDQATKRHLSHEFWFLERNWRKSLERGWFAQVALIFKMETIWALCIFFFVFAGIKKIRKRKQRLRSYPDERPLTIHIAHTISDSDSLHEVKNEPQPKSRQIFSLPSEL